jgi:DNA-binding NarL/FixJ family response regulator
MERFIDQVSTFAIAHEMFTRDLNGRGKKLFEELDNISPGYMMIFDYEKSQPVFFNSAIKDFLGIHGSKQEFSFSFWADLIHPICVNTVQHKITLYTQKPEQANKVSLLVRSAIKNNYTWVYVISKAISYTEEKKPKLICLIAVEIEEAVEASGEFRKPMVSLTEKPYSLISLTKRELSIVKLMCQEYTSKEIANELLISEATVEADRRNMLRKLGVRSMVGLVKYALRSKIV